MWADCELAWINERITLAILAEREACAMEADAQGEDEPYGCEQMTKMSPIYKEARRCYKNGEFASMRIERYEDWIEAVFIKSGKFLQVFASRLVAENEMEKQCDKARKFIQ